MEQEIVFKVYKHTLPSIVSGKNNDMIYIGITSINPEDRWRNGLGYYSNKHFYNAIKKYGWDNFEHDVVAENLTKLEAEDMEIDLISKYNSTNRLYGYNVQNGGNSFGKHTDEIKAKISIANGKPIMCIETNEFYHSTTEAIKITKIAGIKKHLLGEFDHAGKLPDGTKLHWILCDEDVVIKNFSTSSVSMPQYYLQIDNIYKKATDVSIDELRILFENFINKYDRFPLMRECTLENNLPQQRIVNKLLKDNNLTYNDFVLSFKKKNKIRSSVENYDNYIQRFVEVCNKLGRSLTHKELTNNSYGIPNVSFLIKHCPSDEVKTYTDFVKWCGLVPSVKYFDKDMVGENLVKLESNLGRPIRVTDITVDNCSFSYQLVTKYFSNLTNAKQELGLK